MSKEDEFIIEVADRILESVDPETYYDYTSFTLVVKKPKSTAHWNRGSFTQLAIEMAFKEGPDQKSAIEAVKNMLWLSFKDCYEGKIND